VEPVYGSDSHSITGYRLASGSGTIKATRLRPLDLVFLRSQFWYYRGERAKGGLLSGKTRQGLRAAEEALRASVQICPRNALAVYMLGRVYLAAGNLTAARWLFHVAHKGYSQLGWVPLGPRQYLALADQLQSRRAIP
jgi:hypothetical protein